MSELSAVRDGVRALVEKWKGLKTAQPAQPSLAPEFSGERPVVHARLLLGDFVARRHGFQQFGDNRGSTLGPRA